MDPRCIQGNVAAGNECAKRGPVFFIFYYFSLEIYDFVTRRAWLTFITPVEVLMAVCCLFW